MPTLPLTARQIHIIVQALVMAKDDLIAGQIAKPREIEQLRELFQNVKDI